MEQWVREQALETDGLDQICHLEIMCPGSSASGLLPYLKSGITAPLDSCREEIAVRDLACSRWSINTYLLGVRSATHSLFSSLDSN